MVCFAEDTLIKRIGMATTANTVEASIWDEQAELDDYCRAGTLLSVLKSRARQLLKDRRRAP